MRGPKLPRVPASSHDPFLSSSGAEHPPAPEHHHLHPHGPVPAAGAGHEGRHQNWQEVRGVLAPGGRMAAQGTMEPLPCRREEAAPHAPPGAEARGLPPRPAHWAASTPHSGLKQVRVLPTAIAQLREAPAVHSHSATSVTASPGLRTAWTGDRRGPSPVLLVLCRAPGTCAGSRWGARRPRPLPRSFRVPPGPRLAHSGPLYCPGPRWGRWQAFFFLPQTLTLQEDMDSCPGSCTVSCLGTPRTRVCPTRGKAQTVPPAAPARAPSGGVDACYGLAPPGGASQHPWGRGLENRDEDAARGPAGGPRCAALAPSPPPAAKLGLGQAGSVPDARSPWRVAFERPDPTALPSAWPSRPHRSPGASNHNRSRTKDVSTQSLLCPVCGGRG